MSKRKNIAVALRERMLFGRKGLNPRDIRISKERSYPIDLIVDEKREIMKNNCVLLGFTEDGQHLISYTQKQTLAQGFLSGGEYEVRFSLQFWKFNYQKALVKVCDVPLFGSTLEMSVEDSRACSDHKNEAGLIPLLQEENFAIQVTESKCRRAFIVCGTTESRFASPSDDGESRAHYFSIFPSPIFRAYNPTWMMHCFSFETHCYFPFRRFDPFSCFWTHRSTDLSYSWDRSKLSTEPRDRGCAEICGGGACRGICQYEWRFVYQSGTTFVTASLSFRVGDVAEGCSTCKFFDDRSLKRCYDCTLSERKCTCGLPPALSQSFFWRSTQEHNRVLSPVIEVLQEFDFEKYLTRNLPIFSRFYTVSAYDVCPFDFIRAGNPEKISSLLSLMSSSPSSPSPSSSSSSSSSLSSSSSSSSSFPSSSSTSFLPVPFSETNQEYILIYVSLLSEAISNSPSHPNRLTTALLLYNIPNNDIFLFPNFSAFPATNAFNPQSRRRASDLLPQFTTAAVRNLRRLHRGESSSTPYRVLTNDTVISGKSVKFIAHPFLPLIILGYEVNLNTLAMQQRRRMGMRASC